MTQSGGRPSPTHQVREEKKQLKKKYQQSPREMGVFLIRNNVSDKVLLAVGLDLPGNINRHKFQLQHGIHPNQSLQDDWNEFGSNSFSFEIVDQVTTRADPNVDYRKELASLEKLWLEKLQPFGDRGYNARKQSRAEKLQRIAARRSE